MGKGKGTQEGAFDSLKVSKVFEWFLNSFDSFLGKEGRCSMKTAGNAGEDR